MPFISVTITCYNYARYMRRSLEAIKRQSFKDYEVVLVDDNSTDNTIEIVEQFINENPEMDIKLIKKNVNKGVLDSRNSVLDHSSGKYIMFCDSDDWMDDDCLETLAIAAKENSADRVIAEFRDIDENGKTLQIQDLPEHPSKWICGVHHGTLYLRDIFIKNNIRFKDLYPDDVYINMMFNKYAKKFVFIHKPIYNWFIHNDSTSSAKNTDSPWIGESMFKQVLSYTMPIYHSLENENEKEELQLMIMKLYCLTIYHSYRYTPIIKTIKCYHKLHKLLLSEQPLYMKNPYLKFKSDSPMRKYATIIVRFTCLLEKFHLMPIALSAYHVLCKFYYFNL